MRATLSVLAVSTQCPLTRHTTSPVFSPAMTAGPPALRRPTVHGLPPVSVRPYEPASDDDDLRLSTEPWLRRSIICSQQQHHGRHLTTLRHKGKVKSFLSHNIYRMALISVSSDLSQTPAYTARPGIRSESIARCASLRPSLHCHSLQLSTKAWPSWFICQMLKEKKEWKYKVDIKL